jgi:glycine cleavage system H protein
MSVIHGFEFPDDLYYLIETHVWVRPRKDGTVRLGLTPVAYQMLRNSIVAISLKTSLVGQHIAKGKRLAMVESLKYIGPLAAPFEGLFVRGNDRLATDPDLADCDPYDQGWIAEMQPSDWALASRDLLTGQAALDAYRAFLETAGISNE